MIKIEYARPQENVHAQHAATLLRIDELNLEPIKYKLIKEHGWTLDRCDRVEKHYKGFLKLIVMRPSDVCVPSLDIDEMWHTHILDTRKYITDCHEIFGSYMHHYPYLGLKDEKDAQQLKDEFAKTRANYVSLLGFDIFAETDQADCGGGCGGGGCGSSCGSSCSSSSCSSSSCSTHTPSSCNSQASCAAYIPPSSCGTSREKEENKRDIERKREKQKEKKPTPWWRRLGLSNAEDGTKWLDSVAPQKLGKQYRPGRDEILMALSSGLPKSKMQ